MGCGAETLKGFREFAGFVRSATLVVTGVTEYVFICLSSAGLGVTGVNVAGLGVAGLCFAGLSLAKVLLDEKKRLV